MCESDGWCWEDRCAIRVAAGLVALNSPVSMPPTTSGDAQDIIAGATEVDVKGRLQRLSSGEEAWHISLPNGTLFELTLAAVQPLPKTFIPGWQVSKPGRGQKMQQAMWMVGQA